MDQNARKKYWEQKIGKWADSSYGDQREGVLDRLRVSIDARKDTALNVLAKYLPRGGKLLDFGCGTGQFALEAVRREIFAAAEGVDIAEAGIEAARRLAEQAGLADRVRFEARSCIDFPIAEDVTVVTGLGLLDWLSHDEAARLFRKLKGCRFLLSYSEQDNSFQEIVHRVWLCERLRFFGGGVRAYHHKRGTIEDLARAEAGVTEPQFVRNRAMRFGTLVHNLTGTG